MAVTTVLLIGYLFYHKYQNAKRMFAAVIEDDIDDEDKIKAFMEFIKNDPALSAGVFCEYAEKKFGVVDGVPISFFLKTFNRDGIKIAHGGDDDMQVICPTDGGLIDFISCMMEGVVSDNYAIMVFVKQIPTARNTYLDYLIGIMGRIKVTNSRIGELSIKGINEYTKRNLEQFGIKRVG